jgi:ribosome-associated protein
LAGGLRDQHQTAETKRMELKQSKSAKKREHLELQTLGEQLIGFPEEQLRDMQLDDTLIRAIVMASGIKSHGALRRQRQLIGKLMKHADPQPIREALDSITRSSQESKQEFKRAEKWRDRIVSGGHEELQQFLVVTGRDNPELLHLVGSYGTAMTEPNRRAIRRSIFRQVHNDLCIMGKSDPA